MTSYFCYIAPTNWTLPSLPQSASISHQPFNSTLYKNWLDAVDELLNEQLTSSKLKIQDVVYLRTSALDKLLTTIFDVFELPPNLGLFAVGGYGRGELFVYSDVDILLLGDVTDHQSKIEAFVASLWDIGLIPAIAVRTLSDTKNALNDHTVASALLEARFITGNQALDGTPQKMVKQAWTIKDFYHAKMAESKERHLSHNATEYNLEPNIKNGVGGLRDLHILLWLGKFYFTDVHGLDELNQQGFLLDNQYNALKNAQEFLWQIRHHLHTLTQRPEERLLFDYQKNIAKTLGFLPETQGNESAEALMKVYYQHAMQVASLSELLCDYFYETYLNPSFDYALLDDDFYQINETNSDTPAKIGIIDPELFSKKPAALLGIFLAMAKYSIKKISASTLNALYLASELIDDAYRQNPTHKALFLANLQDNNYLFHRLRLMKRYGILARYLPAFAPIMGLMQYDLFHRYTVDAHTLFLIRILHRFADLNNEVYQQKFDLVSQVYQHINRKDILAIASLFHDIAKGRKGDHSTLGAIDAYEFCVSHNMSQDDANFVAWLVQEHLTMSLTAQKQDICDPDVIANFAKFTGTITRLNHLYVLTVADMNATNSQLWNSWRASLLKQLYLSTHRVLSLGVEFAQKDSVIATRKQEAMALLSQLDSTKLQTLWQGFDEDYFLKQKAEDIAWQSQQILHHKATLTKQPIITLRSHADLALDAISLFICIQDQDNLFAKTVCVLDQMGLSVLDATVLSVQIDGQTFALDSYILIDRFAKRDNKGGLKSDFLLDKERQNILINKLTYAFYQDDYGTPAKSFNFDRQLKHFSVPTQVQFSLATSHAHQGHHVMHLITKDRQSLLAQVGRVFSELGIKVHGAKITTMGERAEDTFYLSDKDGATLADIQLITLKDKLIEILY